ncbi:hypothetical protein [Sodalis-like endosymbiont of Proechinophthirus fluctus]|uniref:hypothetical protein n=1 Tax=Sodalis-like endosymbiont of Proechinophthirus fluctus TaxID=1462730 RepID=UPI0008318C6B|nr:hypothetical protein [Sodalis-like endosymbiont of Proechinophthirus fluctus]
MGLVPAEDAARTSPQGEQHGQLIALDDYNMIVVVSREGDFAHIPALASPNRFVLADNAAARA